MRTLLLRTLLAFMLFPANAEEVPGLEVIECTARHKGELIDLNVLLDCSNLVVSPNEQLEVQPVVIGKNDTLRLEPILFTGNIRSKVNHRLARFNGTIPTNYVNYDVRQLEESRHTKIAYSQQIPFQDWMYGSKLILESTVTGCADCQRKMADIPLTYIPRKLAVSYLVPEPEQKIRRKNVSLYLNFRQNQGDIQPDYMDNGRELAKADTLISELTANPAIVIDSIVIIGYASPEGRYDYNTQLSRKRAQALKNYLEQKYMPEAFILTTHAASEDWQGLRDSINNGNLPYRTQLLDIIDSISNSDDRDYIIHKLDGGATYTLLLNNFFPPLRRVVCDVAYLIKPFTAEQAKQRYYTRPEQLSLNEMYLIAQSHPTGSSQFNILFEEMLMYYPDNIVAKNNLAAAALDSGDNERAGRCLESVSRYPEVQNNLGILLFRQGKVGEAKQCFEKACACGCKEALYNLKEINSLMAIQ